MRAPLSLETRCDSSETQSSWKVLRERRHEFDEKVAVSLSVNVNSRVDPQLIE